MKSEIIIPLDGWMIGAKRYNLSMNTYRNMHYQPLNKLKKAVSDFLYKYKLPNHNKVLISYEFYFKDKRPRDIMNYASVVDKYFMDHYVSRKCIIDDCYRYYPKCQISYEGKADYNQVKVIIKEID